MIKDVKFLVMDVDGTLTDGMIYCSESGELFKAFNIKDGCGIKVLLPKLNITPIVVTARKSKVLEKRCKELGISEIHQNCFNKLEKVIDVIKLLSVKDGKTYTLKDVAYIGDDIVDLECMDAILSEGGVVACPQDAAKQVKGISNYVCNRKAGFGAVREFIDWISIFKDTSNFNQVKEISVDAYNFLLNLDTKFLKNGSYELANGVFANVMSYITKPFESTFYESHQKYIDVQFVIYGQELILSEEISKIKDLAIEPYNSKLDITRYDYSFGDATLLNPGCVAIYYPNDCHRGAIALRNNQQVKKIVIKVPLEHIL